MKIWQKMGMKNVLWTTKTVIFAAYLSKEPLKFLLL